MASRVIASNVGHNAGRRQNVDMNNINDNFPTASTSSSGSLNTSDTTSSPASSSNAAPARRRGTTTTLVPVVNPETGKVVYQDRAVLMKASRGNFSSSSSSDVDDDDDDDLLTADDTPKDGEIWLDPDDPDYDPLEDPEETARRKANLRRWDHHIRIAAGLKPNVIYQQVEMPKQKVYDTRTKIVRYRLWQFVDDPFSSVWAKLWSALIMSLILISTFTFLLETIPRFYNEPGYRYWTIIESVIVSIFTLEFVLRVSSTPNYKKFVKNGMNWVDFLAILPFYIEIIAGSAPGLTVIRVIRLTRIFRIFKLGRYSSSFKLILKALGKSVEALVMLMLFIMMGMILSSSLIYFAEQSEEEWDEDEDVWRYTEPHPDVGWAVNDTGPFQSIPHSLWWSITTITTVGYGDMYPITPAGKAIAGITMVLGILIIALPITILGQKFSEAYEENKLDMANNEFLQEHGKKEYMRRIEILAIYCKNLGKDIRRFKRTFKRLEAQYKMVRRELSHTQPSQDVVDHMRQHDIIPIDFGTTVDN